MSNIKGQPQLTNEDLLINGKFLNMEFVPDKMRVYKSCSHPVAAMILVMYVDNNGIRHNCEELVQEFEKFAKMDGRCVFVLTYSLNLKCRQLAKGRRA